MANNREVKINKNGEVYTVEFHYAYPVTPLQIEERKKYIKYELDRLNEQLDAINNRIGEFNQELQVLETINTGIPLEKVQPSHVIGKGM